MTRLLYIEWIKWRRFRPFQILICLYTILFFLICFGLDDIILDKVIGDLTMGNYSSSIILEDREPKEILDSLCIDAEHLVHPEIQKKYLRSIKVDPTVVPEIIARDVTN